MSSRSQRFVFLDGLRGIAALSVAWLHGLGIAGAGSAGFDNTGLAVDFFFCLSGFVVAFAYDERLRGALTVIEFMQKRLIRLYPMIAAGVFLGALAALYAGEGSTAQILVRTAGSFAMLPMGLLQNGLTYPTNVPMWSLFFEILACLGYGLAVKLLPRRLMIAMLPALALLLATAIALAGHVTGFGVFGIVSFTAALVRVGYPFLLGIILFRLGWRNRIKPLPSMVWAAVLVAILFTPQLGRFQAPFHILATLVLLPGVVMIGVGTPVQYKAFWTLSGRLSYPLYLVHWPVYIAVRRWLGNSFPPVPTAFIGLGLAVVSAYVMLVAYDEPVRAWLKGRHRLTRTSEIGQLP